VCCIPDGGYEDVWQERGGLVEATADQCGKQASILFPGPRYKFLGATDDGRQPGELALKFRGATATWIVRYRPLRNMARTARGQVIHLRDLPQALVKSSIDR
jgi:hypothetical protein